MEATQIYAITAGSVFVILTILNLVLFIVHKIYIFHTIILQHLIYPFFIRRHGLIGPWTRYGALWRVLYLTMNICFSIFPIVSMKKIAKRAGHVSLINMIPLFFGPHLSFLADIFGVPLQTYRSLHGASAAMTVTLGVLHVVLGTLGEPDYRHFIKRSQVAGLVVSEPCKIQRMLLIVLGRDCYCPKFFNDQQTVAHALLRVLSSWPSITSRGLDLCIMGAHYDKLSLTTTIYIYFDRLFWIYSNFGDRATPIQKFCSGSARFEATPCEARCKRSSLIDHT